MELRFCVCASEKKHLVAMILMLGVGNEGGLTQSEGKTESEESGTISYIP